MQVNVGIIRTESEMLTALEKINELRERARNMKVEGHVQYNPGWNLATDLPSLLASAEMVTRAALTRKESRGGHTRDDFPATDKEHWAKVNTRIRHKGKHSSPGGPAFHELDLDIEEIPLPEMPEDLATLFKEG
jgi:succinate dehydrogenase / fumarate reductase flavoprotein subunit